MTVTTYRTIEDNAQSTLHNLVKTDADVLSITTNIVDGVPEGLMRGVGFPYIVIPTPTVSEERFTYTLKRIFVEFNLEVWTTRESVCRVLSGIVRNCLKSNTTTTSLALLDDFMIISSGVSKSVLANDTTIYTDYIRVKYEWIGDGS